MASATLRDELRVFVAHRSPRLLAAAAVAAVGARVALGGYGWADLVVVAVILGLEPFTEWFTHVLLLHAKPRLIFGRQVDLLVARKHRAHHADPKDRELVFVPFPIVLVALPVATAGFLLLSDTVRLGLTGLATSFAMLLTYEWTHHLIHSPYRPKRWYFRSIQRAHRNHHFRNERYWFGVTINLADVAFRTMPAKDAVSLSPTARTLGVE